MIKMDKDTYCSVLRVHSKELIAEEGKVLTDLLLNVHNSAVSLSLIPFCALYCRSAKEFLGVEDTGSEIEKEVKDIRNGLKVFTGKYSKGKKMAFESDNQQNEIFRDKIRFSFIKNLNIHFNLGVYFNENGKVIFDTQLANFYLNIPKGKGKTPGEHAKIVGEKLGSQIAEILVKYCNVHQIKAQTVFFNPVPKYGYIDFNTNKKNGFFNESLDKETNLIILHLLSTIGFVNNILIPIFRDKNVWALRVLYVTAHNTWLAINKIIHHFEQNCPNGINDANFLKHIEGDTNLFSSAFRNCMMHYDLVDQNGCPVVLEKWYDPKKPLYGLVESCYNGMAYDSYCNKLYELSKEIEDYLLSYFTINKNLICWNWE